MKKFLLLSASLLLVGAGCAATSPEAPRVEVETQGGGDVQVQAQTPPTVAPGEPSPSPTGATPVKGGTETVDDMAAHGAAASVTITAGGTFSPATITVKSGTTVTWTNSGDARVWVASDPHPVHTDYLGFDSKSQIDPGGTYSFTFEKAGSWNYHNHLNPSAKGTVIVTE